MSALTRVLFSLSVLLVAVQGGMRDAFDEDKDSLDFSVVKMYTPKGCGLDKIPGFKEFLEGDAAKYPDLEVLVRGGEPRIKLFNDDEKLIDTIYVKMYDNVEMNNLMRGLGLRYDPELDWDKRSNANPFESAIEKGIEREEFKKDVDERNQKVLEEKTAGGASESATEKKKEDL